MNTLFINEEQNFFQEQRFYTTEDEIARALFHQRFISGLSPKMRSMISDEQNEMCFNVYRNKNQRLPLYIRYFKILLRKANIDVTEERSKDAVFIDKKEILRIYNTIKTAQARQEN